MKKRKQSRHPLDIDFMAPDDLPVPDPENRFIGWIAVEYIDGKDWRLLQDFGYRTETGEVTTVRKEFIFDFASVPRIFQWLYPAPGDSQNPYGVAALVHDWLYAHRKIAGHPVTRREADALFYEILRYVGCRRTLCWTMWAAVRVGGWWPWNRRKSEDLMP